MAGRPCAYEGCKAWARKDSPWCIAHPEGKPRRIGGGRKGNQNARTHGAYAAYVPIVALEEMVKRADTITGALVRLLRANKALGDEQEGAMEEMLRRVLGADGLGGG